MSDIRELVVIFATLVAARVAWLGLTTWKSEMLGRAKFEVARDVHRAASLVRHNLNTARTPWFSNSEFDYEKSADDETGTDRQEHYKKWAFALANRQKPIMEALSKMDTATLEAEILFDADLIESCESLKECAYRYFRESQEYLHYQSAVPPLREGEKARMVLLRASVFGHTPESGPDLNEEIEQAMDSIRQAVSPLIERAGSQRLRLIPITQVDDLP